MQSINEINIEECEQFLFEKSFPLKTGPLISIEELIEFIEKIKIKNVHEHK
jgi:hypothetical protein